MAQLSKLPPSIQNDLNSMSVYARQSSHARAHVYATRKAFSQDMLLRVKELLQSARPELIGAVLGVILVFIVVGWYVIRAQAPMPLLSNASLETAGAGAGVTSARSHTSDSTRAKGTGDGASSEASGLDESSDGAKDASDGAAGSGSSSGSEDAIVVQVSGSVAAPGVYELPLRARMQDAIAAAGGFAEDASADVLNLAAALEDGQKIYVPKKGEAEAARSISDQNDDAVGDEDASAGGSASAAGGSGRSARSHAPSARSRKTSKSGSRSNKKSLPAHSVSLNRANAEELSSLPGIGEATAKRIIADRRAHGRFKKVEDLCRVKGIGKKKLASIKRYLRV